MMGQNWRNSGHWACATISQPAPSRTSQGNVTSHLYYVNSKPLWQVGHQQLLTRGTETQFASYQANLQKVITPRVLCKMEKQQI